MGTVQREEADLDFELDQPPFPASTVTDVLKLLGKAIRAYQLYLPNNPVHARAMDGLREGFRTLWQKTDTLELAITESDFCWLGHRVLEEPGRTSDSLPWLFYKDGIRELTITSGFEDSELLVLLELVQRVRLAGGGDDDLLTLLWEHEFRNLQYRYVEIGFESGGWAGSQTDMAGETGQDAAPHDSGPGAAAETQLLRSSSFVRMDDYDSTLYFLDEGEIEYLQREIRRDFSGDLREQVIASLLDTVETETDPTVREEIVAALESFLVQLLAISRFGTAAFLIREAASTAVRAPELLDSHRDRLFQLPEKLSERDSLEQLLHTLEESQLRPPQTDLVELFAQLTPSALEPLLLWISRTGNSTLRVLLESAASRLASTGTAELVRLISSGDRVISFEAVRRAGAMKATAAVPALRGVLESGEPVLRLAAVAALAQIGSPGALQFLERSLEDEEGDVRIAGAKALAERGYRAALPRLAAHLRGDALRSAPLAEKMVFFESYGLLGGDEGIALLDNILNSRRSFRRREGPEMRACAAMALGRIATPKAEQVLLRAAKDKDVLVRNAITRAVRGG